MKIKIWLMLGLMAVVAFLASFQVGKNSSFPFYQSQPSRAEPKWPTRRQLWQSVYRSRELQIVYPAAPEQTMAGYRDYYQSLPSRPEWLNRTVQSDAEFPIDSLGRKPLTVVGAMGANQVLQRLLPHLPIQRVKDGFRFRGENYTDSSAVLSLLFPHPHNPQQMLTVLTGNSDRTILDYLRNSPRRLRQMSDYWVAQQGRIVVFGFFKDSGETAWQPEAAHEYNLQRDQRQAKTTEHFAFITHGKSFSSSEIEKLASRYEKNLELLMQQLAIPKAQLDGLPRLAIHLWESAEEKGMFTGNTDLRHVHAERNEVHLLWRPELRGDDFGAEASWLAQSLLGESKSAALQEGLAAALCDHWRGAGCSGWAARLVQTLNAPPLADLFDPQIWQAESDLVRQPLLGSFVALLLEKFGAEQFIQLYRSWPENGWPRQFPRNETWEQLVSAWQEKMQATPQIPLRHPHPPQITPVDFHRGFCYAHEGYQIYNGYLGSHSREALAKLAALGANAISITPFGYLRRADQPDFLRRSNGAGAENDESLVVAKGYAKQHGMRVMLKPHILMMEPNWGWPGDIQMQTAKDWEIFFDRYERWMRHYAMLAEMYDFDMLCVGVELMHATKNHEQKWRKMIERWRGLYSGPMVYAANWWQEFESIAFVDALEAIGVNCYYPLSQKENPLDEELIAGAERAVKNIRAVAKRFNKPVLVTEIGFTSAAQTWKSPHEDKRDAPIDLEAQRRCYEAICKALGNSTRTEDWLAGVYWWKWPTTLEDGGPEDNQFTPNGKPAEEVVARWYRQKAREAAMTSP